MPFQQAVGVNPAPARAGDFASANPHGSMLAGPGAFVAGVAGALIARFGFVDPAGKVTNAAPANWIRCGFIHRDQPVFITTFLGEASERVYSGLDMTLFDSGDFWMRFAAGAAIGQRVFASYADGTALAGTAGQPPVGGVVTAGAGSVFTGAIASPTGILTVSAVTSGVITVGDAITGTGVPAGTTITGFLTGTNGGVGTYQTSTTTAVASTTITETSRQLQVTAVTSGALVTGEPVSGTGVPAGSTITGQTSGAPGGVGVYTLSAPAQFALTAVTAQGAFETRWFVDSLCAAGELAMCSTRG